MPLSRVNLTLYAEGPEGPLPAGTVLTFALSGPDAEGGTAVVGKRFTGTVATGVTPAVLSVWRNIAGLRNTHYRVTASVGGQPVELGNIRLLDAASYDLGERLGAGVTEEPDFYTAVPAGEWAAAEAAARALAAVEDSAAAGAAAAASGEPFAVLRQVVPTAGYALDLYRKGWGDTYRLEVAGWKPRAFPTARVPTTGTRLVRIADWLERRTIPLRAVFGTAWSKLAAAQAVLNAAILSISAASAAAAAAGALPYVATDPDGLTLRIAGQVVMQPCWQAETHATTLLKAWNASSISDSMITIPDWGTPVERVEWAGGTVRCLNGMGGDIFRFYILDGRITGWRVEGYAGGAAFTWGGWNFELGNCAAVSASDLVGVAPFRCIGGFRCRAHHLTGKGGDDFCQYVGAANPSNAFYNTPWANFTDIIYSHCMGESASAKVGARLVMTGGTVGREGSATVAGGAVVLTHEVMTLDAAAGPFDVILATLPAGAREGTVVTLRSQNGGRDPVIRQMTGGNGGNLRNLGGADVTLPQPTDRWHGIVSTVENPSVANQDLRVLRQLSAG